MHGKAHKNKKEIRFCGDRISFLKKLYLFLQKDLQFTQNYDIILSVAEKLHTGV